MKCPKCKKQKNQSSVEENYRWATSQCIKQNKQVHSSENFEIFEKMHFSQI
ncbi:hypothetical protein T4C_8435 [Trichinella pseudospiralis]|uniref:Uncharacterized protein n=1 Tax=Trichinella pseudospiralis TaxID=6337 RepID=A0A0V1GLA4_TRIPS|nr:hypothetical protein T4C_8435 [Trichinella pseudospiralis]